MIVDGVTIHEGDTFDIFNPFNGKIVGSVVDATDADIYNAL